MIDAAGGPHSSQAGTAVEALADWIIDCGDRYAARDLLHHQGLIGGLADSRTCRLKAAIDAAALVAGKVPAEPLRQLTNAVEQTELVIGRPKDQAHLAAVRRGRA